MALLLGVQERMIKEVSSQSINQNPCLITINIILIPLPGARAILHFLIIRCILVSPGSDVLCLIVVGSLGFLVEYLLHGVITIIVVLWSSTKRDWRRSSCNSCKSLGHHYFNPNSWSGVQILHIDDSCKASCIDSYDTMPLMSYSYSYHRW